MRNSILLLALSLVLTAETFEPARFESGTVFVQPPMTLGGGDVLVELEVGASGAVSEAKLLRTTPPFGDLLREAVRNWRFAPAREVQEETEPPVAVDSKVLVAGLFRPPTLYDAPARGEEPANVASSSNEVPFPTTMVAATYPPTVYLYMSQVVVIEVEVGTKGEVKSQKVIQGAEGLNAAALEAATKWRFRPAQRNGKAVASFAYIVFGFRQPVVSDSRVLRPHPRARTQKAPAPELPWKQRAWDLERGGRTREARKYGTLAEVSPGLRAGALPAFLDGRCLLLAGNAVSASNGR